MRESLKNISRIRVIIAAAVMVLMAGLSLGAVWGDGLQWGKLLPALFLSVMAGVGIVLNVSFGPKVSSILTFLFPLYALCCMEFYTHVPWDLTLLILILNYIFYLLLYLVMGLVFGSSRWGYLAAPVFPMLFGLVNYFVVSFRSSPIVPWDIFSLGTAVTITDNYTFSLSYRLVFVLLGFVFLMILGEKTRLKMERLKVRLAALAVSLVLMGGYITAVQTETVKETFKLDDILFTPNVLYRNNGFIAAFMANLQYLNVEKPTGYSVNEAARISTAAMDRLQTGENTVDPAEDEKSNVIVIMNEAFSDLGVYGDFGVSEDYMPFIHSLSENTVKGNLYVSVKGGNTANTEFEFLTGNTMAFMPAGSIPYQQFIKSKMPSLAEQFNSLGYKTAALHPYYPKGWNRNTVYPDLGFQESYFKDDFTKAATLRGYVDDRSAFEKLIELYEEKGSGEKLFAFEVTMQNHGGYSKEYDDLQPEILLTDIEEQSKGIQIRATEKYLTLIKKTDESFEELLAYFAAQDEKTIVVMFGDHQPSDYVCNPILRALGISEESREESPAEFAKGYAVPFIIWGNYDIEEEEIEQISANYLSGVLMEKAGLSKTGYQEYLADLRAQYPVVTANFYTDASGQFYEYAGGELNEYAILQYNNLVDIKRRVTGFF